MTGDWVIDRWVPDSRHQWAYHPLPCPVCHCDEPHVHQVGTGGTIGLTYFTLAQLGAVGRCFVVWRHGAIVREPRPPPEPVRRLIPTRTVALAIQPPSR